MHRLVRAYPWSRCGCARVIFILLLMTERATYRDFAEGNYPGMNKQEMAALLSHISTKTARPTNPGIIWKWRRLPVAFLL